MATDTTALKNVIQIDDRNGNHYWICDVYHVTGTITDILVPNGIISGAQLTTDGTAGGDVLVDDDDTEDGVKEASIAAAVATGDVKVVLRFSGSAAGVGGGHGDAL